MNKRGINNLEFILSFILFAGFVGAAIYFINPAEDRGTLSYSANYIVNEIITNSTINIESYSVKLTTLDSVVAVSIPGVDANKNARVEDYNGNVLPSRTEGDEVIFERQDRDFVIIKFGEDYEAGTYGGTATPSSEKYKIASVTNSELISEKRIEVLKAEYEKDYSLLKAQRNIPSEVDFTFRLELPSGQILETSRRTPAGSEVFSETKIREILKNDGASEFGYLNIKIW